MINLLMGSVLTLTASAGLTVIFRHYFSSTMSNSTYVLDDYRYASLLRLQSRYGYNPQSLVSLTPSAAKWFDYRTQSGLTYTEYGKIRLVAGDILAADENIVAALGKFLAEAQAENKIVAFMPATEKFAKAVIPFGFKAVKIGASPYFDLTNWNPRGNKAKKMRAGCNQAKRAGVSVEQIFQSGVSLRNEVLEICENWMNSRRAGVEFEWLFKLDPFLHIDRKKYFTARNTQGKLVGLLTASPIPAREGWYLEDFLRLPDSPNGTTDLLIFEALKTLANEGAKIATLGTVPLAIDGDDSLSGRDRFFSKEILGFARDYLDFVYNFKGLRHFKGKFVPSWWESEYVLIPDVLFASPRVANAFAHALLPKGLFSTVFRGIFSKS